VTAPLLRELANPLPQRVNAHIDRQEATLTLTYSPVKRVRAPV
jgi:hypothetical protein